MNQVSVAAPRWARRLADAPPRVLMTATGPPHLRLVERGRRLRQLRGSLDAAGMRPDLAVATRWRRRVVADGPAVLGILVRDEERADARGAWWVHDVRWSDTGGATRVLYEVDEDGHDLVFFAWGPDVAALSERLRGVLEALA